MVIPYCLTPDVQIADLPQFSAYRISGLRDVLLALELVRYLESEKVCRASSAPCMSRRHQGIELQLRFSVICIGGNAAVAKVPQ